MEKKRNYSLDLLRVIACYLVIHQHASEFYYIGEGGSMVTGEPTYWVGVITTLCRSSVPLFAMLSGFFLLPLQGDTGTFFRKRLTRVVWPFVLWCVLYAVYYVPWRGDSLGQMLTNILHIPVNFGSEIGHLWYIYMLIGLYLVAPIISPWLRQASRRELECYLGLWVFTTLLPYIHLVFPAVMGEVYWNETPLLYYFTGFIGYFILGHYLRRYGYPSALASWGMLIVGYALSASIFCLRIDSVGTVAELELSWQFCTINVLLMTLGLFSLIGRLHCSGEGKAGRLLTDVSAKSYGMYLAHIMVLNFYYALLKDVSDSVLVTIPLIALCTFVTVYELIRLLSYLPGSKWLVG